ncbi:MAG TPA: tetratricopeptide repeat protein [Acidobacteriaceae bacterium]|jgi:tetratricopeptide (TPR) repeat protein|nr:tetratricopeptide repeat protein [Acidobacteriaceae bacterium]
MTTLHAGSVLTPEERVARRNLILRDALSLLTLFLFTVVIFALTLLLYRSFENHRVELGQRWKVRGEQALRAGRPKEAIDALRSALAYVPNTETEIELATALADAGRTTEATAYFNTLRESTPGDGMINLQLAQLAARQGNETQAVLDYQAALDGTWQGNGYDRRREIRLELANYLLSRHKDSDARLQLLIAAGNAPDDATIKIEIAGQMERANDQQNALGIYRSLAARRSAPLAAVEGAGRTAFALGEYRIAADYLAHTVANIAFATLPENEKGADREMLDTANHILQLFPSINERPALRAQRILSAKNTAHRRITTCTGSGHAMPPPLPALVARWEQLPSRLTVSQLEQDPDLEQTLLQLVYDTETATAQACGAPTADDASLLRIAHNPIAVEQP